MPNYSPEHLNLYVTGLREKRDVEGKCGVDISNIAPVHLGGRFFVLLNAKFVASETCLDALTTGP